MTIEQLTEQKCEQVCHLAGVRFVGVQKMYGYREDHLLFQERQHSTTLSLPLSRVSAVAIGFKIEEAKRVRTVGR